MDDPEDRVWIAAAIMWAAVLFAAFAAVYLSIVGPAAAQVQRPPCMPVVQFAEQLEKEHRETLVSTGLVGDARAVMFFSSPGGMTWTLLSVDASGMACGLAAGTGWDHGRIPAIGQRDA